MLCYIIVIDAWICQARYLRESHFRLSNVNRLFGTHNIGLCDILVCIKSPIFKSNVFLSVILHGSPLIRVVNEF